MYLKGSRAPQLLLPAGCLGSAHLHLTCQKSRAHRLRDKICVVRTHHIVISLRLYMELRQTSHVPRTRTHHIPAMRPQSVHFLETSHMGDGSVQSYATLLSSDSEEDSGVVASAKRWWNADKTKDRHVPSIFASFRIGVVLLSSELLI
jgi:hypothetical protein